MFYSTSGRHGAGHAEIVAVDIREDRKLVKKFVKENGYRFPILLDKSGKVASAYGARSIPTTYIIDREGYVVGRTVGAREWDTEEVKVVFRDILDHGMEIMIETFTYGFDISPPDAAIRKGDKVRLTVKGKNGTHGLSIPEYKIATGPLKKGDTEVFEFVVARSGKIEFKCNVFCGSGHRGMEGFLEVAN